MKFKPNRNFEREFMAEPSPQTFVKKVAEEVRDRAKDNAPVGTGHYRDSIAVVRRGGKTFVRTNDMAGHMVEWGSVNQPPAAPIRKGVRAAGLKLDEQ